MYYVREIYDEIPRIFNNALNKKQINNKNVLSLDIFSKVYAPCTDNPQALSNCRH